MKKYELFSQEGNNFCVCSVLKSIFNQYGISLSQKEISKNLTPAEKGFRVDDEKITNFLNQKGFNYFPYKKDETPFNEPDSLIKEMLKNDGFLGIDNHAYLLMDFKDPLMTLGDPKDCSKLERSIYSIREEMELTRSGYFCLLKKTY